MWVRYTLPAGQVIFEGEEEESHTIDRYVSRTVDMSIYISYI